MNAVNENPLGSKAIPSLLKEFAIPSIIAMLVSSLYNIVDQFFIGQSVGSLGNSATSVFYPLTIASPLPFYLESVELLPLTLQWVWAKRTLRAIISVMLQAQ